MSDIAQGSIDQSNDNDCRISPRRLSWQHETFLFRDSIAPENSVGEREIFGNHLTICDVSGNVQEPCTSQMHASMPDLFLTVLLALNNSEMPQVNLARFALSSTSLSLCFFFLFSFSYLALVTL